VSVFGASPFNLQQVFPHRSAVLGVGAPDVAGAHPRFGVAFAKRPQELATLPHPLLDLHVLDPKSTPAVSSGAAESWCQAAAISSENPDGVDCLYAVGSRLAADRCAARERHA
jgi:hypothetical protein